MAEAQHTPRVVLVTGAAGFIGCNAVRELLQTDPNLRVISFDALTYAGSRANLADVEKVWPLRHRFIHADIRNRDAVGRAFDEEPIDTVLHLAAESRADRSTSDLSPFIETNVMGTFVLLEAARKAWQDRNDVRFHHVSTDEVFGSLDDESRFTEDTPYDPSSPYSASKAASDHLVRAWSRTFGIPTTLSNCSNNFGPHQCPEKPLPLMISKALAGEPLPVYRDGGNVRDWLYVADHCAALDTIVRHGQNGRTYNVGGDNECASIDLLRLLCQLLQEIRPRRGGYERLITFVEDRPGHDRRYAMDSSRLRDELGWMPAHSFRNALRETVAWYLAHGEWMAQIRREQYDGRRLGARRTGPAQGGAVAGDSGKLSTGPLAPRPPGPCAQPAREHAGGLVSKLTARRLLKAVQLIASGRLGELRTRLREATPRPLRGRAPVRLSSTTEQELLQRVRSYNARKPHRKAKVVCYTAVFGGYDSVVLPEYIADDWDYVCFTDFDLPGEHIFEIRRLSLPGVDPRRRSRYVKTHPHEWFPDHEYSLWLDANYLIRGPGLERTVAGLIEQGVRFAANPHPHRSCVYEELEACIMRGKDDADAMSRQVGRYKDEGMPERLGMLETGMLLRRHGDPAVVAVDEVWWNEIRRHSSRDQLSVMYALWRKGLTHNLVDIGGDARFDRGQDCLLYAHRGQSDAARPAYTPPTFLSTPVDPARFSPRPFDPACLERLRDRTVDIVVCVHNAYDDVVRCLESVLAARLPAHRLILVDDGSEKPTRQHLEQTAAAHPDCVTRIRHEAAQGYVASANDGLHAAEADLVVLLNSDTVVPQNWALKLLQAAESGPDIGIVGPLSNAASWQSVPQLNGAMIKSRIPNDFPEGMTVEEMNHLCETVGYFAEFPRALLVNGFCYGITRRLIETIGYLDLDAFPVGYGEEDDYTLRASAAGFSAAVATHCYVWHAKSKSFGSAMRRRLIRNARTMLYARHGMDHVQRCIESMQEHGVLSAVRTGLSSALDLQHGASAAQGAR
jgi:dTDP-glucose 4,6-dehydratase